MFDSVSTERILVLLKNGLGRDSAYYFIDSFKNKTRRYVLCLFNANNVFLKLTMPTCYDVKT